MTFWIYNVGRAWSDIFEYYEENQLCKSQKHSSTVQKCISSSLVLFSRDSLVDNTIHTIWNSYLNIQGRCMSTIKILMIFMGVLYPIPRFWILYRDLIKQVKSIQLSWIVLNRKYTPKRLVLHHFKNYYRFVG